MKVNSKAAQPMLQDRMVRESKVGKDNGGVNSKITPAQIKDAAEVNVSARAKNIQKANEIARQDSVDEAKIARLQALIDKGEYKVDADKIADKLVDEHLMTSGS